MEVMKIKHCVFLLTCLSGVALNYETTGDEQEWLDDVTKAVDHAATVKDFRSASAYFQQASPARLDAAQQHLSNNIAIRAAWERVRRTITETEEGSEHRLKQVATARFVGFVEGRLGIMTSRAWSDSVLNGRARRRDRIRFKIARKHEPRDLQADFLVNTGLTVTKRDSRYHFKTQTGGYSVGVEFLGDYSEPKWTHVVEAVVMQPQCYIAFYSSAPIPFKLIAFQAEGVAWDAEVWASGGLSPYSGQHSHVVTITGKGQTVYVFGAATDSIYIEGFDVDDGTAILRFSSNY